MKTMADKVVSAVAISKHAKETAIKNNHQTMVILVFHVQCYLKL